MSTIKLTLGDDDLEFEFEFDLEPYDPGSPQSMNDPGDPPTGGFVSITQIRRPDGTVIFDVVWAQEGFTPEKIKQLEETIYEDHIERVKDDDEAAAEAKADADREDRREYGD